MKIVISTKHYSPMLGGSIQYARMLAAGFVNAGLEVIVMTRTAQMDWDDELEKWKVVRRPSISDKFRLAQWCDVVLQIDGSWQDGLPFILLSKPLYPTIHHGKKDWRDLRLKAQVRLFFEQLSYTVGRTIAVSETTARDWGSARWVIPNPYDSNLFYRPQEQVERVIDIIYVGRITADKGVLFMVDALTNLHDQGRQLQITFVGSGSDLNLLKKEVKEKLPKWDVCFTGRIEADEVAEYMRKSKVLAFPTTPDAIEASPLTVLEAVACGCFVVATDTGGTSENVPAGHELVKSGDLLAFRESLIKGLDQEKLTSEEDENAFLQERKIDVVCEKYLKVLGSSVN